jgi:pimeloyl-ACP methyl ester carboxylesterase
MTPRKFFVDAPGARLYVDDTGGTGPAILLAHAQSGNAPVWQHQQQAFSAAGFRVIAWSRRGSAPTELIDGRGDVEPGADIDVICGALALDRFHAIGTAAGGGVMLRYATRRPERFRCLVIANSHGDLADPDFRRRCEALRPPPFVWLPVEVREIGPSYRAANPAGVRRWLDVIAPISGAAMPGSAPAGSQWSDVAGLAMPVLWLTGDADLYMPPPLLGEFHARLPGSEMVVIENAGHSAFWEQPEAFNAAVLSFIRRRG